MIDAVPDAATLAAYTATALVLIFTPGPDMTLFVSRTLSGGRSAGFASMAGVTAGLLVHSALATIGLSALLAASPAAFDAMKYASAAYLAYLAVQAIRHGSAFRPAATAPDTPARVFVTGLMINITNPKIVLFFVTFLPQFVAPGDPHATAKIAFLGLWYVVLSIPSCALVILGAARLARLLDGSPRWMRVMDWLTAGVFGAFAVRLALAHRQG